MLLVIIMLMIFNCTYLSKLSMVPEPLAATGIFTNTRKADNNTQGNFIAGIYVIHFMLDIKKTLLYRRASLNKEFFTAA